MATLNKDNLNRLITALEQSIAFAEGIKSAYHEDPVGFNMGVFFASVNKTENRFSSDFVDHVDNCGTVACLAGWCAILDGRSAEDASDLHVADYLGIDFFLATSIVYGSWIKRPLMDITAQEALEMLKDLLLSEGKPEWYRAYLLKRDSIVKGYYNTSEWDQHYAATFGPAL